MALHYLRFIWTATSFLLVIMSSSSLFTNSQVEGCSLVGIDLHDCLVPINQQTPFSISSCCTTLNKVLEAGHYCLCTLLGPSGYPVFSVELRISLSTCYITLPPLTHCHVSVQKPIVLAPPAAAMPLLTEPPPPPAPPLEQSNPFMPALKPPDLGRGEGFVPLPPKVNEIPLSEGSNSSIFYGDSILNNSHFPMIGIPERWDYVKSDGADVEMLVNSKNLLNLVIFYVYVIWSWI